MISKLKNLFSVSWSFLMWSFLDLMQYLYTRNPERCSQLVHICSQREELLPAINCTTKYPLFPHPNSKTRYVFYLKNDQKKVLCMDLF